jgi:hypothetical protein
MLPWVKEKIVEYGKASLNRTMLMYDGEVSLWRDNKEFGIGSTLSTTARVLVH